jgi:hypothetical protein
MAQISREALEQHKSWRKLPDAMHNAWQAVGAARAKTFPASSLGPLARKRAFASGSDPADGSGGKRNRSRVEIDAYIPPDSTCHVSVSVCRYIPTCASVDAFPTHAHARAHTHTHTHTHARRCLQQWRARWANY